MDAAMVGGVAGGIVAMVIVMIAAGIVWTMLAPRLDEASMRNALASLASSTSDEDSMSDEKPRPDLPPPPPYLPPGEAPEVVGLDILVSSSPPGGRHYRQGT